MVLHLLQGISGGVFEVGKIGIFHYGGGHKQIGGFILFVGGGALKQESQQGYIAEEGHFINYLDIVNTLDATDDDGIAVGDGSFALDAAGAAGRGHGGIGGAGAEGVQFYDIFHSQVIIFTDVRDEVKLGAGLHILLERGGGYGIAGVYLGDGFFGDAGDGAGGIIIDQQSGGRLDSGITRALQGFNDGSGGVGIEDGGGSSGAGDDLAGAGGRINGGQAERSEGQARGKEFIQFNSQVQVVGGGNLHNKGINQDFQTFLIQFPD